MKQKLCLFLMLIASASVFGQTGFSGNIIDGATGMPIPGVHIILRDHNVYSTSNNKGEFIIKKDGIDTAILDFISSGYDDVEISLIANQGVIREIGTIQMKSASIDDSESFYVDESQINDEDGSNQTIGSLSNASSDVFLRTASYNFSPMRYSLRGYDQRFTSTSINGVNFNDGERGRFNFSMFGGMNSLFKNKDISKYTESTGFGFGDIGGSTNVISKASGFAKGTNVAIGATNRAYVLRGTVSVASGLLPSGWAFNGGLIYRWSDEGAWDGTFYNSFGYYLGAEKIFNKNHRLSLITFGAPTQRAQQSAVTQEAYDLAGSIYYNSYWGYHNGEKRNSRVVNAFDPTAVLSYEWQITPKQKLSVSAGTHYNKYSSTALTFYNAPDPRPDYYRYMPSYVGYDTALGQEMAESWRTDSNVSQIDWESLYQANYANNVVNPDGTAKYAVEERHSDMFETSFNATYNAQANKYLKLTAGIDGKYSNSRNYKTMNDLLGGNQWIDIDQFAERDFSNDADIIQNDLNNPNRVIKVGDVFGYDYDMNIFKASAFLQNEWNVRHFEAYYGAKLTYYTFQRDGNMRNGRAEALNETSYGKGKAYWFIDPSFKAGLTYKPNGHHRLSINGLAESRAPLANNAYISPRIKDTRIPNLQSEKVLSYDANYEFNYRRFRGKVSAFRTHFKDGSEISRYYDDGLNTFVNHVLTNVDKCHSGVEAAFSYKINGNFSVTAAGSYGEYKYTNNALGIISAENGSVDDTYDRVMTKDLYTSNGPQLAGTFKVNYFHSKMWFAEAAFNYFDRNYLSFAPIRFTETALKDAEGYSDKIKSELFSQEKLKGGYMIDFSVGKVIYLKQRSQSLNINLSCNNVLNNKKMVTGGFQQGRLGSTISENTANIFPNKYYYAQGFNLYLNLGYKF